MFDHLRQKSPYFFCALLLVTRTKSMETFAWRLSKVYYLCLDAFHSLPALSSSPSFSCHSAALIFIPLVCLSFTRRIHPTYQLQPSNRFPPRRLPHGNSFLMNFKRDVSALTWKTESGNGKEGKKAHPGWHHGRIWMLTVALDVSVFVKRVHFFQEALGFNSPQRSCKQNTCRIPICQFLSRFETKRSEQE